MLCGEWQARWTTLTELPTAPAITHKSLSLSITKPPLLKPWI
jgi:hypothetical protein